jgi:hypothetical protein
MTKSFRNERAMLSPIHLWLADQGFFTKYEFQTPWGICDLVGVRPVADKVTARMSAGGKEAIGSSTNAAVLLAIPSVESGKSISPARLAKALGDYVSSEKISQSLKALKKKRFIESTAKGYWRRIDAWHPFFDSIVAIEFKLSRVEEVLLQATHHKGITQQSYVALPAAAAERALIGKGRERFSARGVGVIALSENTCATLLAPETSAYATNPVFALHAAERFWPEISETIKH